MLKKVWNGLDRDDRLKLLNVSNHFAGDALKTLESKKKWDQLLLSSQEALEKLDWNVCLGRDVSPL